MSRLDDILAVQKLLKAQGSSPMPRKPNPDNPGGQKTPGQGPEKKKEGEEGQEMPNQPLTQNELNSAAPNFVYNLPLWRICVGEVTLDGKKKVMLGEVIAKYVHALEILVDENEGPAEEGDEFGEKPEEEQDVYGAEPQGEEGGVEEIPAGGGDEIPPPAPPQGPPQGQGPPMAQGQPPMPPQQRPPQPQAPVGNGQF